jgi:hypothetical protein
LTSLPPAREISTVVMRRPLDAAIPCRGTRLRLAVTATVVAITWALSAPSASAPGGATPDACADPVLVAQLSSGQSGCCHYNGGVCGCESGRVRCCDGKASASCRCGTAPLTRQARITLEPLIAVDEVAFTNQNTPEPPTQRLKSFRAGGDALWLWLKLSCSEECWSALAPDGPLNLELRWLFDPGSGPLPTGPSQQVSLARGQRTIFVRRTSERLKPGQWEAEVRFDTERLCTRNGNCWFPIEVRP